MNVCVLLNTRFIACRAVLCILQFTHTHIYLAEISRCSSISLRPCFFYLAFFVSKLNNKSEKEEEFVSGFGLFRLLLLVRLHHNQTNEKWTKNDAYLFTSIVEMKLNIKITKRKRNKGRKRRRCGMKFSTAYVRAVLICFVPFRSVPYSSSSLFFLLSRIVVFVSFAGIQITTIFNTIPELECFWYVYLEVLSCVFKRKSTRFRFLSLAS